jgi:hypothetical protein
VQYIKTNQLDKFAAVLQQFITKPVGHGGLKQLDEKVEVQMFNSMKLQWMKNQLVCLL